MKLVLIILSLCCCSTSSSSQLRDRQHAALASNDLLEAVRLGRGRIALSPDDQYAHYDFACALARAGDSAAAFEQLHQAVTLGFDSRGVISEDEDLSSLRARPEFAAVLEHSRKVLEEGIELPQLETLVLKDLPTPVRLRRTPGAKQKLIVWLHPSGARANATIERFAPLFAKLGYALAVPIGLREPNWSDAALRSLLDETVPKLSEWADVEQPVLVGFSAGGEAAIAAWRKNPQRFAKVIVTSVTAAQGERLFVFNGDRHEFLITAEDFRSLLELPSP